MPYRHNGVNAPVFSLKSRTSGGIGEFLDLIPLIDWAKSVGLDTVQILPTGDSGLDASPYNLQSAFAQNPLYIKWPGLGRQELNALPYVAYDQVRELKEKAVKKASWPSQEMKTFVQNYPWVEPYARLKEGDKSIFEQYVAYKQLKQVKDYADKVGVQLLGDIPILLAPDSVDVKIHPELFLTNLSSGAPPDMYSETGQNWGFPPYNWEAMQKDDYAWWKARLSWANEFYHLYRIDHIVGFYRIWVSSRTGDPLKGDFLPKEKALWIPHGEALLKMMQGAVSMKPIGEDLGTVPDEVRASLTRLGIPGTKVMRWERKWREAAKPYIPFKDYPQLSLTTVSTHDSSPLQIWWESHPEDSKAFADILGWTWTPTLSLSQVAEILRASHRTPSAFHINLLSEYLRDNTRINTPGTQSEKNWSWRMRPYIEDLSGDSDLNFLMHYCLDKSILDV